MSIFFETIDQGDKVTVRPIGKRAGILGIVSFITLIAAWILVFTFADYFLTSIAGVMALGVFTLSIFLIPSLIGWIDHLPEWFFPSTKKPGQSSYLLDLRIYEYSLKGTSKSMLKADVGALRQQLAGRQKTINLVVFVLIASIVTILLIRHFSSK